MKSVPCFSNTPVDFYGAQIGMPLIGEYFSVPVIDGVKNVALFLENEPSTVFNRLINRVSL